MNEEATRDDLGPLAKRVQELRDLVDRLSRQMGPGSLGAIEATLARNRSEVYAAMDALGHAVHAYKLTCPAPDRLDLARRMVADPILEWSNTSPVFNRVQEGRLQPFYHELIQLVRDARASGADAPALIFNDYYVHSVSSNAARNRFQLMGGRLYVETQSHLASGVRSPRVVCLQYDGGATLMQLASNPAVAGRVQFLCLDSSAPAIRHATRTLGPVFKGNIQFQKTDVRRWLFGPDCEQETAHVVIAFSLLERWDDPTVVSILQGAHRLLCRGGVLLAGSVTPEVPLGEKALQECVLARAKYERNEQKWRELLAMTPFALEEVSFDYEPLHVDLVLTARRAD